MNDLKNLSNKELIVLFKEEEDYLLNRFENRVKNYLYKKYKKYKSIDIIIYEKVVTHKKNLFYVIYNVTKNKNSFDAVIHSYGCREINGKKQIYFVGEDSSIFSLNEFPIKPNKLSLINQHVFERYNERCELNLSEDEYIFMLLEEQSSVVLGYNKITNEVQIPVNDGLILGTLLEDGTTLYKTFVNRLFSNQSARKYFLNKYKEEEDYRYQKNSKRKENMIKYLRNK